jgi:Rhodopirellula transposase DDE domain
LKALEELLQDAAAGDPITGIKWTRKTLRAVARSLRHRGLKVGFVTVGRLLRDLGYEIHVNRKRLTRDQNPERDRQMRYLIRMRKAFIKAGKPVISVDTKKRELIGNFRNTGGTWRRKALEVLEYDYPSYADGVAIPYGIYDLTANEGFIVIGISHQTPAFAIAAIRRWWNKIGTNRYKGQCELLIEADCGNPNAHDSWHWKFGLQQLADEFDLTITVTHLPTGASKWNPVEHRLFSQISDNWAGQPLVSYETILKFIRTTKTASGLKCRAYLDRNYYETGLQLTGKQKAFINLFPRRVLPKWNYTIKPHNGC